jgi:hypothetical protein
MPAIASNTPLIDSKAANAAPIRKRQLRWPLGRKRRASKPSDNFIPTFLNGYRPFDRELTGMFLRLRQLQQMIGFCG